MIEPSNADVVISTQTDVGDDISDLLVFKTSDGEYKSRALAIDGKSKWAERRLVTVADVDAWIARLRGLLELAKERVTGVTLADPSDTAEIHVQYDMLSKLHNEVIPLLTQIRSQLLAAEPDADVIWQALASAAASDTLAVGVAKDTLTWECVWINWADTDASIIPLRAGRDVLTAVNHGVARIITKQTKDELLHAIEFYAATPLFNAILNGLPSRIIITDATPSPGTKAMIKALGGSTHTEIIPSPVAVAANYAALLDSGDASEPGTTDKSVRRSS